jgi:hypothetical protein
MIWVIKGAAISFVSTPYPDQPSINYSAAQWATSYTGSMSDIVRKQLDLGEDEQSKASVYTSYAAQEDRQVRREGGRVRYIASGCISLKGMLEGLQYTERNLLCTHWCVLLVLGQQSLTLEEEINEWERLFVKLLSYLWV